MIFVTGGTGMLGTHLLFELLQTNEQVTALKREKSNIEQVLKTFSFYTDKPKKIFEKINWINADITDYASLESAMTGATKVFHAAAFVSFNPKDKSKLNETNVKGTENIVNISLEKNIEKFCFVSSIASLGSARNNEFVNENTHFTKDSSNSAYSISKYKSELEVWRGIAEGLNAFIVNPSVIIGSGDWNSGSPGIIKKAHKGMPFYTSGSTGYVDVRDVAKIITLLDKVNITEERFIISSENLTYKQILDIISKRLNKKAPKYEAKLFLLKSLNFIEKINYALFRKSPIITSDIIDSLLSESKYSNEKIRNQLNYEFIKVKDSLAFTSDIFLKDFKS